MKADQCIRGDLEVARTDRKGLLGATIPVGSTMGMTYDEFVKFFRSRVHRQFPDIDIDEERVNNPTIRTYTAWEFYTGDKDLAGRNHLSVYIQGHREIGVLATGSEAYSLANNGLSKLAGRAGVGIIDEPWPSI